MIATVLLGDRGVVGFEVRNLTADRKTYSGARRESRCLLHQLGKTRVAEHDLGLAVADDIGDLVGRQMPVDGRVAKPSPEAGVHHLRKLRTVATDDRNGVPFAKASRAQCSRQAVAVRVELPESAITPLRLHRQNLGLDLRPVRESHTRLGHHACPPRKTRPGRSPCASI